MLWSVAVVLLLAGCQGNSRYENLNLPPQYRSGAEIRDALDRSGLGCADFQTISQATRDIGEREALEVDTCRVENMTATMMIWLTLGEAQDWARSHQSTACRLARSVGTDPPVWVDGGRWTVTVKSRPIANRIADAIGGQAKYPECGSAD